MSEQFDYTFMDNRARAIGEQYGCSDPMFDLFDLSVNEASLVDRAHVYYVHVQNYSIVELVLPCDGSCKLDVRGSFGGVNDPMQADYASLPLVSASIPAAWKARVTFSFGVVGLTWLKITITTREKITCLGSKVML